MMDGALFLGIQGKLHSQSMRENAPVQSVLLMMRMARSTKMFAANVWQWLGAIMASARG
jgi:hypothetical protein